MIQAFQGWNPTNANTAFVAGYDFLMDSSESISHALGLAGLPPSTLINNTWNAAQLQSGWLNTRQDLASVNAHFDHWQAIPANTAGGTLLSSQVIASTTTMSGTVNFSMGCHSGFSVHDDHAVGGHALDFAQALAQKGAWWIGNTGYGYGMDDSIAFTEEMMDLFVEKLASGQSVPVGEALRWAKNRYIGSVPSGGFGTYDEKAMIEATLYGLPMYRVSAIGPRRGTAPETPLVSTSVQAFEPIHFDLGASFQLHHATDGDYHAIGDQVQASPGRPVQPRTSQLLPLKTSQTPHGAVMVGATSIQVDGFIRSLLAR